MDKVILLLLPVILLDTPEECEGEAVWKFGRCFFAVVLLEEVPKDDVEGADEVSRTVPPLFSRIVRVFIMCLRSWFVHLLQYSMLASTVKRGNSSLLEWVERSTCRQVLARICMKLESLL
jgi:hypothetical protein